MGCVDELGAARCGPWKEHGECLRTFAFMSIQCRHTCGMCESSLGKRFGLLGYSTWREYNASEANAVPITPYGEPAAEGSRRACEEVHVSMLSRQAIFDRRKPLIIHGIAEAWPARVRWRPDAMRTNYGNFTYRTYASGASSTIADVLDGGRYAMGHVHWPRHGMCYHDTGRTFTPWLLDSAIGDYHIPPMFHPMKTLQMGFGHKRGLGVPPEHHPSSFFAAIVGRKRWVLHPPSHPRPAEAVASSAADDCAVPASTLAADAMVCDQLEGEVIWLPDHWWHETCGLDDYSAGLGGIVYPKAALEGSVDRCPTHYGREYLIDELPYCQRHACSSLYELHTQPVAERPADEIAAADGGADGGVEGVADDLLGYGRRYD